MKRPASRRGILVVLVLLCLLVVMSFTGSLLQGALGEQRQLRHERAVRQADLLVRAGRERARYQLAQSAQYRGETWRWRDATITLELAGDILQVNVKSPANGHVVQRSGEFELKRKL